MKKSFTVFFLFSFVFLGILSCSTKVLRNDGTNAIILAGANTKIEAIVEAEDRATELFGSYRHVKEPDCNQEYSVIADKQGASGSTHWVCSIQVQKTN